MTHCMSCVSQMNNYVTVKLNEQIGITIDKHIELSELGFASRADFVKHAIREYFKNNGEGGNGNKHSSPSTPKQIGEKQKCVEQ